MKDTIDRKSSQGGQPAPDLTLRIEEARQREHHLRMRRFGVVLTLACVSIGVAAPLLDVRCLIVSMIQAIGAFFAIDMWVRARRGLRQKGALNAVLAGRHITVWHDGCAPPAEAQPLLSATAYPDFVMLVAGADYRRLHQFELFLVGPSREPLLRHLSGSGVPARTARHTRGVEIVFAITALPLLVALAYLGYRALLLIALGGIVYLLKQLPVTVVLALFFLLGAAGLLLLAVRLLVRRRKSP